jgi:hypothetical protein
LLRARRGGEIGHFCGPAAQESPLHEKKSVQVAPRAASLAPFPQESILITPFLSPNQPTQSWS